MRQVLRAGAWEDPEGWDEEGGGGGVRIGNTCKSMADSCQCMTKPIIICKVISLQLIKVNEKKKSKDSPSEEIQHMPCRMLSPSS